MQKEHSQIAMAHRSPGVASLVMVDVEADDGTRVICSPEVQSVRTVRSLQQQLGTGGADRLGDEKDTHMPVIEVRFKLEKETKGALRYQEGRREGGSHRASLGQDWHALRAQKRFRAWRCISTDAARDCRNRGPLKTSASRSIAADRGQRAVGWTGGRRGIDQRRRSARQMPTSEFLSGRG